MGSRCLTVGRSTWHREEYGECKTNNDCTQWSPHCSKLGFCQWTDEFGTGGPGGEKGGQLTGGTKDYGREVGDSQNEDYYYNDYDSEPSNEYSYDYANGNQQEQNKNVETEKEDSFKRQEKLAREKALKIEKE